MPMYLNQNLKLILTRYLISKKSIRWFVFYATETCDREFVTVKFDCKFFNKKIHTHFLKNVNHHIFLI